MVNYILCVIFQRLLLPTVLCACIAFRPIGISLIYAGFLFMLPYVPVAQTNYLKGTCGKFYIVLIALSSSAVLLQTILQTIWIFGDSWSFVNADWNFVAHRIGYIELQHSPFHEIAQWVIPDVIVLLASIITFTIVKKLSKSRKDEQDYLDEVSVKQSADKQRLKEKIRYTMTFKQFTSRVQLGKFSSIVALCFAGVVELSLPNGVYFACFLSFAVWLAMNRELSRAFAIILKVISMLMIAHISIILVYQIDWAQDAIEGEPLIIRILGLPKIYLSSQQKLDFNSTLDFDHYMNPLVLVATYLIISCTSNFILHTNKLDIEPNVQTNQSIEKTTFSEILMRVVKKMSYEPDDNDEAANVLRKSDMRTITKLMRENCINFIFKNAYIVTNVSMMIWSIFYHSWLGFVFLMWSNAIWVRSDQRGKMMSSSPFLVIYATSLLVIHYVYGMCFTDDEPTVIKGINMQQIGLIKYEHYSGVHLLLKSLLTLPFWFTMRILIQEKANSQQKRKIKFKDAAQKVLQKKRSKEDLRSESLGNLSLILKSIEKFFVFCWMWIIVLTLFLIGMSGAQMSLLRIASICFALTYILMFQLSFKTWLRAMYLFWSSLILYSMGALIIIYAYQFDDFPNIPWQTEIGLRKYQTGELFVKLLPYTLMIIMTGLQINYFHQRFWKYFDETIEPEYVESHATSCDPKEDSTWEKFCKKCVDFFHTASIAVELHFHKLLFLVTLWLITSRVHILNGLIIILLAIGAQAKTKVSKSVITISISALSMIIIVGSMFHELSFERSVAAELNSTTFNCNVGKTITPIINFEKENIVKWLGFNHHDNLKLSIASYFAYIIVVTSFYALLIKQKVMRMKFGEQEPTVIFKDISRINADESFGRLVKFFTNYGFFKFGVEVTLLIFFIVIICRLDVFTMCYVFWFSLLVFRDRHKVERIWRASTYFVTMSIIVQCLVLIIFIPFRLCESKICGQGSSFAFACNFLYYNLNVLREHPGVLVGDLALLMCLSSQLIIFSEEKKKFNTPFEGGGSNKSILKENIGLIGFEISHHGVYAFKEQIDTFIDVLKAYVFHVHFWVSLGIIFLATTHRVDIFSLGYIANVFVFLWLGTDFYVRPLKEIIKRWNALLAYNVTIILLKITINFIGCNFGDKISAEYHWLANFFEMPWSEYDRNQVCHSSKLEEPFIVDGIIFAVILFQRRIFLSYYFFNVISDTIVTSVLSSRGAEMLETLMIEEGNKQMSEEHEKLVAVRAKMELIKKSASTPNNDSTKAISHDEALHAGDYYMFADDDDTKNMQLENASIGLEKPTEKSSEPDDISSDKTTSKQLIKRFLFGLLVSMVRRMQNLSRKYRFIIQVLAHEKKALKGEHLRESLNAKDNFKQKLSMSAFRQESLLREMDEKLRRISIADIRSFDPHVEVTVVELIKAVFYFLLSHSDLLVLSIHCLVQIVTSSLLTLPLTLVFLLWAALTYPRPSKSFWILVIAYTQTIIIIKYFSQFDVMWWDSYNLYIQILGNQKLKGFATYELFLLMTIFLHRAILKTFGLWKSTKHFEFRQGTFRLDKCDEETAKLIEFIQNHPEMEAEEPMLEENVHSFESTEKLISDEETLEQIILSKQQLKPDYESNEMKIKSTYKDRSELLRAREEIFEDQQGQLAIKLRQGTTKLRLHRIKKSDSATKYPITELVTVESVVEDPFEYFSPVVWMSIKRHAYFIVNFLAIIKPKRSRTSNCNDVYKYIFLCDFINFLVLLFGFTEFDLKPSTDNRTTLKLIEENKIPTSLLFFLVIQFAMIIIDRVIYLKKSMVGKVVFYLFIIIYTHVWMFLLLPIYTERKLNTTKLPILYYIIKCIYLLLSAYQIRCGFPTRILGNFLTKQYGLIHSIAFKVFMQIPFLFELRSIIDWMFTPTSLKFFEWIRVEAIYAQVFDIKCNRENRADDPRGKPYSNLLKLLVGGGIAFLLIFILWFPLFLFAYSPALGQANIPKEITINFQLGNYEPVFEAQSTQSNVHQFTELDYMKIRNLYDNQQQAKDFLGEYEAEDTVGVVFTTNSSSIWNTSPPNVQQMISDIRSGRLKTCRISFKIYQPTSGKTVDGATEYYLKDQHIREQLTRMLESSEEEPPIEIPFIFPKFVNVQNNGKVRNIPQLLLISEDNMNAYRNVTLQLHRSESAIYWELKETCNDTMYQDLLEKYPFQNCRESLTIFIFNDKSFPSQLNQLAVQGIVGLYITLIVFFSSFFRSTIFNFATVSVIVEELPNVDQIISLCNDIYNARESMEFTLEEDLVAKLIFLYRSPETLIKVTKPKSD